VANAAHARRYLEWSWELDGSLSIRGRLPAEDGAAFVEMIETGAAALRGGYAPAHADAVAPDDDDDDRGEASSEDAPGRLPPLGARRADVLAEVALSGAPRAQVVLHVDDAALACTATDAAERAGETCELEDGPAIPSESARRLTCDAEVITACRGDDGAIDYGRRRRVVSPPLRTVLERRDRGCRYPGCDRRHDLHAHHIRHWAHGGRTHQDNLVLLCRFHHRLVHEDGFSVQRSSDGAYCFRRRDGERVPEAPLTWVPPGLARGQPIAA
jgi:hypothetical protein